MKSTRRTVLKIGAFSPLFANLAFINEAAAAVATDYKALVMVFLSGGNDYANTLIPYDNATYATYYGQRPGLAYAQASLQSTLLRPTQPLANGCQYALAPALRPLLPLFDQQKLAVLLNVGTLVRPVTKAQYLAGNVALPPRLMSHNDQQNYWQATSPEGAISGWGGRICDATGPMNADIRLSAVNLCENTVFLTGKQTTAFAMTPSGPVALNARTALGGSGDAAQLLQDLIRGRLAGDHMFEAALGQIGSRALDLSDKFAAALSRAPRTSTVFPAAADPNSTLGAQLAQVAKIMAVSRELGVKRQIFYVSSGKFDNHDGLADIHPLTLTNLADAMRSFYDTTVELGMEKQVTTFTASDFGRALTANRDGSDHGWGSMHFVMGGDVKGGRYYGANPVWANNGPDDIGQGRLIPTMSVDQYAATLARWFGVAPASIASVAPNIGNFTTSMLGQDVGFV